MEENREKIKPIIETIILCGRQNILLRGHRYHGPIDLSKEPIENDGNFRALLFFRVNSGDETLKYHLQTCSKNAKYISPHTQNVLISCCNDFIVKQIVSKVNLAKCFTVLADETTDITEIQQMSLGIIYIDTETEKIREDFIQFVPIKDATGRGLAKDILNTLSKLGVDMTYMRGQGYDGASAMIGDFVYICIYILALYIHRSFHVLNLAVSNACDIKSIRNCLGIINTIHLLRITQKIKRPSRINRVKSMTQLYAPQDGLSVMTVFMEYKYDAVINSLFKISQWPDREAASNANLLLCSIQSSEFIVSFHVVKKIFSISAPLSRFLQSEHLDLANAMGYASAVEERLLTLRDHAEDEFKKYMSKYRQRLIALTLNCVSHV
ncbi:52 kDa repressor of the inhibitor of the protein kinase-like [Diorhabda carinulata]|uniref:52 kDa repressor of the inhibitor of the protein kinase-like n=1 Tax=Diorhabda carinulata TaxID=1163345 RepID=UPI0025A1E51B|nr:52 kDa repressor of the inhibitor of the protein kinase-like [Diorhabda carinulata]